MPAPETAADLGARIEVVKINDTEDDVASPMVPHERQVVDAVIALWKEDSSTESLGAGRLHALVKARHPNWTLSEKRMKTLLKNFGLSPSVDSAPFTYASDITSQVTPDATLPEKVNLVMTSKRGKGLYAKKPIANGELIWEETPLFLVPLLAHYELILLGKACTNCGKMGNDPSRALSRTSVLQGLDCNTCPEIWCSLTCKVANQVVHSSLKHGGRATRRLINPEAFHALTEYCVKEQWNALYAITLIYAQCLLDKTGVKAKQFKAMARVSQKVRYKALNSSAGAFDSLQGGALFVEEQQEKLWEEGFNLFANVFPSASPQELHYDEFLHMMGTYNINNLDSSVFLIQSHLNHVCDPNTSVDTSVKKYEGLRVHAARDIKVGEELTTTYVNPSHTVQQRQRELRVNWGFLCKCPKCKDDLKTQQRRKSSSAGLQKDRSEIKNLLEQTEKELGSGNELEIPVDYNGERRKSVRFDEKVVKVTP
ncbi:SET domain-containing protein [Metschnikowia bicuspidata var. bicuspidata NRRL YB-4993]|uniref:Histone-lysine N-methyltransferase SET5 n=1 Tax=Metschnikowia bicuspidata var. bicuspidata NRRL YB-4993 TaxID=869754 RepID=A0A1A0H6B1_9ASCO|nr:SET domain-containing protein [Metschnikowia bicuspidata var. bicuspidata NRRL YB-4993]OBA19566.1 SET domain-containing protein [Metschnikowia bicuspidata var. bicuspidata NRRL YB-4993]